jgi:hypothetical protein
MEVWLRENGLDGQPPGSNAARVIYQAEETAHPEAHA